MEKKNTGLIILVIILSIFVILLGGYIVYDKVLNKDNTNIVTDNNKSNTASLKEASDYLNNINILETKLTRTKSKDFGDNEEKIEDITLSQEQLKELLNNMSNYTLTKKYGGLGGQIKYILVVNYELNEKEYGLTMLDGLIAGVEKMDSSLINLLDKAVTEENTDYKDLEGSVAYYIINNFDSSIFDKYFD